MNDSRTRAEAFIAAGRPGEARTVARDALDTDGPDAGLFLVLARAHMAEDDDDHDDAAERVFRDGLDAFPDDIGLLGGYAELCARTDVFERPGRRARGEEISARLRELAPYSAELRRAEEAGKSVPAVSGNAVSERRVQAFDAARAFAAAPAPSHAADQAAQWAARAPYDRRLAVLAETTAALAAPGRAWLRLLLCRASEYRLAGTALVVLFVVLRVTVLPVPYGVTVAVLVLLSLPDLALRRLLRGARERGAARASDAVPSGTDDASASDGSGPPELPPVPRFTRREYAFAGAGIALALVAGGAAYASSLAYPHYEVVAHDEYRGMAGYDLQDAYNPFRTMPGFAPAQSVARVYAEKGAAPDAGAAYLVAVAVGDFHKAREPDLRGGTVFETMTEAAGTVHDSWEAGEGPYGGWMQCARYTETASGTPRGMCVWADKGSLGLVLFTAADDDREAVETTARSVGGDFLRPADD
ncbi:hypothetical protein ACIQRS_08745 [Streptomyces termitum]|uniref:Tetratricopeptide repeat protein n=1 Tax=Streptomyces termitum TaxID=67368 RepID=A0A918W4I8_9ACTN|nr:hypothetical protein [Streptomyces termitum]GHA64196.1 hypothetical protein GCM10010305_02080 [Streptomyces termitum]